MNNPYKLNTWLNPVVQNYIEYFGMADRPVVWEVGSRDGEDGVELATRIYIGNEQWFWSRAMVVLVEPNPAQADIIAKSYPEAELHRVAVSDEKGTAPFKVYAGDAGMVGSSSLNLEWKEDAPGHVITVDIDRLDNLVGDDQIDIMKIDVEGRSFEALKGLGDKLKQVKVFHIETEKWTDSDVKVKAHMLSAGYRLVDESEQYGGMSDQVWVRA
jgi:FkbM family methyltransferase